MLICKEKQRYGTGRQGYEGAEKYLCTGTETEKQNYSGRENERQNTGTEGLQYPPTGLTVMNYQHLTSIHFLQAILHTPNPPGPILMPIWISNTAAVPVDTRHHTKRAPAPPTNHHLQRVVAMPRVTSLSPRPLFHLPPPPALAQCTMPAGLQITKQTPTLSSTPLIQIQVRNYFTDTLKMYFITVYWTVFKFEAFTNKFSLSYIKEMCMSFIFIQFYLCMIKFVHQSVCYPYQIALMQIAQAGVVTLPVVPCGGYIEIHMSPCSTPSDISGPPTPVHTSSPLRTQER